LKELIAKLGKIKFAGSNTQDGRAYHTFDGAEVHGQAGNVSQRVCLILNNYQPFSKKGIDLGCSIGGITLSMARAGAVMTGIDYDFQSIDVAMAYADEFNQIINYKIEDIDLKLIKEINQDFVIWFSHWMWFCKQHGFETGLDALYELGKKEITVFFETSLGEGMAGNVMKANNMSETKLVNILNNCFHRVRKIGVDEYWRKRPIFKCEGKPYKYKCYHTNTVERLSYYRIFKKQPEENAKRESKTLTLLQNSMHFPRLFSCDGKEEMVIEFCGKHLKKLPNDWKYQAEAILRDLKNAGILHRDIIPRNILINEGIIKLIDLSWSGAEEDYKIFPGWLGTDYRAYPGFDDRYSLYKSLEYIGGIQ